MELLGLFDVRQETSTDLLGEFVVQRTATADLLSEFSIRRSSTETLLGEFIVRHPSPENLLGEFIVRQGAAEDLLAVFDIGGGDSEDLLCLFDVRQEASVDLLAVFLIGGGDSEDLLAEFIVRHPSSMDLPAEFVISHPDSVDLLGIFDIRYSTSVNLLGVFVVRQVATRNLPAEFEVGQGVEDLPAEFIVQSAFTSGSANLFAQFTALHYISSPQLYGKFEVGQGSEDLLGSFTVRKETSLDLPAAFEGQASVDLIASFHIQYRRIFGENWQRKSWFTDPYYWRSYYSLALDSFVFEYIHKTGLTGNLWTENVSARIDASGFDAAALEADFSVRGPRNGLPIMIVYSDGRDVWVAESDEASVLGWAWQNTTKVFDATAPDWYRYVGMFADRRTPTPALYVVAVYYDDAPGVQYVRFSEQSTPGDITGWETAEDVSNTANTANILGVMGRSMGSTGATKKEVIVIYKEDIALRSRYHTAVGGWQAIQDIDTTTELDKSLACFDAEHYELAGDNCLRILYIDADNTVRSANRSAGIAAAWGSFVTLDASITEHDNVGIINVNSIQFHLWQDGCNIGYRQHRCNPDTWWPALADPYNEFRPDSEAVITTTGGPEQIQSPDDIVASDAVVINWIGLIGGAAGIGWGILQAASVETLPGEFVIRHSSSIDLPASFEGQTSEDLLFAFTVRQESSVDLPAQFLSAQGDENLLCTFVAIHTATLDLKATFDAQASLNIPGAFVIRRSNLFDIPAEFVVLQGWGDLPAEFFVQNGGTIELLGGFAVRHAAPVELHAEFVVRNIGSANLLGFFEGQTSVDLFSVFDVRHPTSVDLPAGFRVRHFHTGTGIIIANDPAAFFNYSENVGTGFLSRPHYSRNTHIKVTGRDSLKIETYYISKRFDYIQFGWKYRNPVWGEDTWPGTYKATLNLPDEFVVRHSSPAPQPGVRGPGDLPAQLEVGQGSADLPAGFFVLTGQAFNDLAASFFVMPTYTSWSLVWTRDYGVGPIMDGIYVDDLGNCYMTDLISDVAYTRTRAGVETSTADYYYAILRAGVVKAVSLGGIGYVLGENEAIFMQFDINRYGAIVASINVATDNPDTNVWLAYHMSSNGKYIAFVVQGMAASNMYVMLYEGS